MSSLEELIEKKAVLLEALRQIDSEIQTSSIAMINRLHGVSKLSNRQREVIRYIQFEHLTNKEIGEKLNISERTVKFHVSRILRKYGKANRTELIW